MSPRNRKILKIAVVAGSIVTAPAAIVTASLARDQVGWPLVLTLGAGGALLALSVGLGFVYQWIQKADDRLHVELAPKSGYPTLPSCATLTSWIDAHIRSTRAGMLAVLYEKVTWETRRTVGFNAADPDGWRPVEHECVIGDLEEAEQRRNAGEVVSQDEKLMLDALDRWRKRPVLGLPNSAAIVSRDRRTITEYRKEVDNYLLRYERALRHAVVDAWVISELGAFQLEVTNHNEKPVEALEIVIVLPDGIDVVVRPRRGDLATPRRVCKFGEVDYSMGAGNHNHHLALFDMVSPGSDSHSPRINHKTITYSDIVVTSGATVSLPAVHLLTQATPAQVFAITWDAAATKSTPGRCNGSLRIHVNNILVDADKVMNKVLADLGEI